MYNKFSFSVVVYYNVVNLREHITDEKNCVKGL